MPCMLPDCCYCRTGKYQDDRLRVPCNLIEAHKVEGGQYDHLHQLEMPFHGELFDFLKANDERG